MFCEQCGRQLDDSARFCPACGRPARVAVPPISAAPETLASHVRVLGILWAIYGVFQILTGIWTVAMAHVYVSMFQNLIPRDANFPTAFMPFIRIVLIWSGIYGLLTGAAGAFAGWALLRRAVSGLIVAIVVAFVSLISFPLGTGLGLYTLIEFLPASARDAYTQSIAVR